MKQTYRPDRLLRLAAELDHVSKAAFDMDSYVANGAEFENKPLTKERIVSCGTTACALGWACTIPAFKSAGLKIHVDNYSVYPVFNESKATEAGAEFFGIPRKVSEWLFGGSYDNINGETLPRDVARRIRSFVADPFQETN